MRSVLILMVALVAAVACKSREDTNPAMPEIRFTPLEALGARAASSQPDRSGLEGVRTTILFGDPSKPGMYSILLYVPAHTTIPAHSHRDNRMATVIIGTWRIGYGNVFDAAGLKELPPGSIYSEPGAHSHFAQTRNEPVLLHIVGYGPTNTIYVNQRGEPRKP